jgi:8-oxo-dGTP pyrophosphatase MutT (NUDIX family)
MGPPVQPAATVVVLRPMVGLDAVDHEPEIYMLRRSSKSAFMPDALVFPGGRVEPEDGWTEGLDGPELDEVFAQAARRECVEEASLALDGDALRWFDTWQTPSGESPRRFLARFFVTAIAPDRGHDAVADGVETRAGRWACATEILSQWEAEQVDLPPPTLSILLRIAAGDWRGWLDHDNGSTSRAREPILPKVAPIGSNLHIVMPHDPDYAALPGDAGGVPDRVHVLPRRFIRIGKRWVPQP